MLVGGLSVNFYSIPRSTKDADFVLRIQNEDLIKIAEKLKPEFQLDSPMGFETKQMTTKHVFRSQHSAIKKI